MNNQDPILEAHDLSHTFHDVDQTLVILDHIDLELEAGQTIAIMGSSGSGKSTLLHCLAGLMPWTSGEIKWLGQSLKNMKTSERHLQRNRNLGFIYQFHHLLPELTALENVALPLLIGGYSLQEARVRAYSGLSQVGLSTRTTHKPGLLSGGERQRVAIARALIQKPACILADEPTGNLDHDTAQTVWTILLNAVHDTGSSLIVVSHDPSVQNRVDRTYRLNNGKLGNLPK